jgi:hypothetical protein
MDDNFVDNIFDIYITEIKPAGSRVGKGEFHP